MSIESFVKDRLNDFDDWRGSPELLDSIAKARMETHRSLDDLGRSAKEFLYDGLLKGVVFRTVTDEAKSLLSGKYNMAGDLRAKTGQMANAGWSGLKVIGNVAKATGNATKLGALKLLVK